MTHGIVASSRSLLLTSIAAFVVDGKFKDPVYEKLTSFAENCNESKFSHKETGGTKKARNEFVGKRVVFNWDDDEDFVATDIVK